MTMPCHWGDGGLAGFAGRVRFVRRFGYPGRIDAHERVWLTFAGITGRADIVLNGHALGRHDGSGHPPEFEVTSLLGQRNELAVEVEAETDRGGLWGEVALEVRRTAFLRGVRAWSAPHNPREWHVAGEVIGTAERPLDLYVLADGATVGYLTVEAAAAGRSFDVTVEGPTREGSAPPTIRVELVDGGCIWYGIDCEVAPGGG
jgi:hypothetical protein